MEPRFVPSVRSERLEVEAASPAVALALQPRLSDLNRQRLLPVIERVLREAGDPARQVRIERLRLDLGEVLLGALESELPRRLERELRLAVHAALRGEDRQAGVQARSPSQARAELLEEHLLHGTLPFWAPPGTSLRSLVEGMAQGDPELLARTVRRLGGDPRVLRRLAAQLGDAVLARLVRVLEPEHGALVLAYVLDLRRMHRRAPLLPLSDRRFGRELWMVVQAYLLRDPGSEFNRRTFLRSLLRGMAAAQGLDYAALLATLQSALERTRRRHVIRSSLPAVLGELLREAGMRRSVPGNEDADVAQADPDPPAKAVADHDRVRGEDGQHAMDADGSTRDDRDASPSIDRAGGVDGWRAVDTDGSVRGDRGASPSIDRAGGEDGWRMVDADDSVGGDRNASSPSIDRAGGKDGQRTVDADGSARRDLNASPSIDRVGRKDVRRAMDADGSARDDRDPSESTDPPRDAAGQLADRAPELERYETADALRYLLRNGVLPWTAAMREPHPDEAQLFAALPSLPLRLLRGVLRTRGTDERRRVAAALARGCDEDSLTRLLQRLAPALDTAAFRGALASFASEAADRPAFLARVLVAAVAGEALDLEAFAAEKDGPARVLPAELAAWPTHRLRAALVDALRAGPAREAKHPTPAALLAALAAHPADARYLLRALAGQPALAPALARAVRGQDALIDRLHPRAAPALRALHATLAALPASRRPPDDHAWEALLLETMRAGDDDVPGASFYARVLARLFGSRLPEEVESPLRAAADGWARPGGISSAHGRALHAALHALRDADAGPPADASPPRSDPAPTSIPGDAVIAYLLRPERGASSPAEPASASSPALSHEVMRHAVERMLDEAPEEIVPSLRRHAGDRRMRERWIRELSEPALARLAHLLEPRRGASLLRTAELLDDAWSEAAPAGAAAGRGRRRFWQFFLRFLARGAGADRRTDRLVAAFFADRAARCRRLTPLPDLPAAGARLLEAVARQAGTRGHTGLRAALRRQRTRLLAFWAADAAAPPSIPQRPAEPPRPLRRPVVHRLGARDDGGDGEPIYLRNAGLVLASPFLPRLFTSLGLVEDGEDGRPRFRDGDAVSRGVHLLQYLVDGSTRTPEPELVLNKLLCGAGPATPVDASIRMSAEETSACDALLSAILANWPGVGGTSAAGLRETFLQREGRLVAGDERWKLTVQRRTLDVLVDQVPWSLSIVYHRWMTQPLHVSW